VTLWIISCRYALLTLGLEDLSLISTTRMKDVEGEAVIQQVPAQRGQALMSALESLAGVDVQALTAVDIPKEMKIGDAQYIMDFKRCAE
jgi:hypothetical protein